MDLESLAGQWRKEANDRPVIDSGDVDIRLTLRRCADQLSLAYHGYFHESEFIPGCPFCAWEQEHNDRYPERWTNVTAAESE